MQKTRIPICAKPETICGGSIGNHPSISAARSLAIQIQSITGVKTFSAFRYGAQNIPDAFRAAKKPERAA
ncbi:MAG: hypothetical protein ACLUKN_02880 [Bacilli bacterium]